MSSDNIDVNQLMHDKQLISKTKWWLMGAIDWQLWMMGDDGCNEWWIIDDDEW